MALVLSGAGHRDELAKLLRLYRELGRPQQNAKRHSDAWSPAVVQERISRLWSQLPGDAAAEPDLRARWLTTVAALARPDACDALAAAVCDGGWAAGTDAETRAATVAAATWCLGPRTGRAVLLAAIEGVDGDGRGRMLELAAGHLGEASADYHATVSALASEAGETVREKALFGAWSRALGTRRAGVGHVALAERALLGTDGRPSSLAASAEARNGLVLVAAHDRSPRAEKVAIAALKGLRRDRQTVSTDALHAVLKWCNLRPRSDDSAAFGPAHSLARAAEEAMVACRVAPTPLLLHRLLGAYALSGDVLRCFSCLQGLKAHKLPVSKDMYLTVLQALSGAALNTPAAQQLLADPSRILFGLLVEMAGAGVEADALVLNSALRVFAATLRHHQVLNRSASSMEREPADRRHVANMAWDMFYATSHGTKWHPAVAPNRDTFHVLIQIFCAASLFQRAADMLDAMRAAGIAPDVASYNLMLRVLAKKDQIAAEDLLVVMTNSGLRPDSFTMDAFLIGYLSSSRPESGISMIQSLFNQYGSLPSQSAFLHAVVVFIKTERDPREIKRVAAVFRQLWPDDEGALAAVAREHGHADCL